MAKHSLRMVEGDPLVDSANADAKKQQVHDAVNAELKRAASSFNAGIHPDDIDMENPHWKIDHFNNPRKARHPSGKKVRFWKKKEWKRRKASRKNRWVEYDSDLRAA